MGSVRSKFIYLFFWSNSTNSNHLRTANVIETPKFWFSFQFMVLTEYMEVEMALGYLTMNINCISLRFVY